MRVRNLTIAALSLAGMLAAADNLPKAETILDKYIEVTGGKEAYAKLHNEVSTGTMEISGMGLKGALTAYAAEPNKRLVELNLPGIGKVLDGSNGEVAWSTSAIQGPRVKSGDESAQALLEGQFNQELHWRDHYKSAETVAVEQVDGKDAYKISVTPKTGAPMTRWYDKQSGLLVKMAVTAKSPMGDIESTSTFSDYRKEGDVTVPHKVVASALGREMIMTIEKVQHNADLPKERFDLPEDIQSLIKKAQ